MRRYTFADLITKNMSREQRLFWMAQLFLLLVLINTSLKIHNNTGYYMEVENYCAVEATLTNSIRYVNHVGGRKYRHIEVRFTNTYEYMVDDITYTVKFTDQKREGYNRTLYYNPNDPSICSEYKSYFDLVLRNSFGLIGYIFGQTGLIMIVLMRKSKKQEKKTVASGVGIVVQDDFDFGVNDKQEKEESNIEPLSEEDDEVLSIPFKLTGKKDNTNTRLPWDVQDEMNSEKEIQQQSEFVLYTEEEYQKLKS